MGGAYSFKFWTWWSSFSVGRRRESCAVHGHEMVVRDVSGGAVLGWSAVESEIYVRSPLAQSAQTHPTPEKVVRRRVKSALEHRVHPLQQMKLEDSILQPNWVEGIPILLFYSGTPIFMAAILNWIQQFRAEGSPDLYWHPLSRLQLGDFRCENDDIGRALPSLSEFFQKADA